jgi:hypothetical protein
MSGNNQHPIVPPPYSSPSPSAAMDYSSEVYRNGTIRNYLNILLKRKWQSIASFLSVFLFGALYTFTWTPIFRTTAMRQITEDNPASQVTAGEEMDIVLKENDIVFVQESGFRRFLFNFKNLIPASFGASAVLF